MSLAVQTEGRTKAHSNDAAARFSREFVKAPFFLRCAAFSIDYILLLSLPVAWLVFAKFFLDGDANTGLGSIVWLLVLIAWIVDFLALPLLRGQTIGKMLAGITIVTLDGSPVGLGRIFRRNVIGYFLSTATFGLGFLIAAINKSGRSLHDFVAGTIAVHGRRRSM